MNFFCKICPLTHKRAILNGVILISCGVRDCFCDWLDSGMASNLRFSMKQGIHPEYKEVTATCSCGNVIKTRSTLGKDINLDVCGKCHPFYTGKQRVVDTGGRVERFNSRFKIPGTK